MSSTPAWKGTFQRVGKSGLGSGWEAAQVVLRGVLEENVCRRPVTWLLSYCSLACGSIVRYQRNAGAENCITESTRHPLLDCVQARN